MRGVKKYRTQWTFDLDEASSASAALFLNEDFRWTGINGRPPNRSEIELRYRELVLSGGGDTGRLKVRISGGIVSYGYGVKI